MTVLGAKGRSQPGAGGPDLVAGVGDGVTFHRRSGGDALVEHGRAEEGVEVFDGRRQVQHPGGDRAFRGGAVEGGGGLGLPGPVKLHGQAGEAGGQVGVVVGEVAGGDGGVE